MPGASSSLPSRTFWATGWCAAPSGASAASDFIAELASLAAGDIVVHSDHGIGRFIGLKTIEAAGAPHDCLEIHYAGDGRLFLPVENIELLSRYGSDTTEAVLDRLGGGAWQSRKARLKRRLLDMAGALIRIAAERQMRAAPVLIPPEGLYGEFSARFPYEETDDQQTAIDMVMEDLSAGKPMDRLICGDVGFGKTEVALRAAFVAALEGLQVAVVVPTTLLARQHFKTFSQRFAGLPVQVRQASRLVGPKQLAETKKGIADGTVDIVVGTHALLGASISFKNLGLLIIDEEQHFGVKHKERLKELKSDVHVLTLSATPIPRTLQLALTGVRELSLITTPPVDRMAVRTFISPFDPLVIRETLLRERYRGGHSFYVVPRIADLPEIQDFLHQSVPELKVGVAHGQMPPGELDDIMNAFYDGQYDVLLSTSIVESGLDIPTANTLIVHRADMFGLAQLYQLRGRVGRSKVRAYALFTLPANRKLTDTADRRLKVLQSLDTLGAGFQLASHDLDIRGAGNLLGEEQSGHIKEVGFELYQQMLEEAVAEVRGTGEPVEDGWSPQITIGTAVMIPESYVPDLQLRLALYRRLAELENTQDIDAFGAELIDRFGSLPEEVEHLLKIVFIKALCRQANVEKLDAGPKGVVIQFRKREFSDPVGLVRFIGEQGSLAKIRPDQSVVFIRDWPTAEKRLQGAAVVMTQLARLAQGCGKRRGLRLRASAQLSRSRALGGGDLADGVGDHAAFLRAHHRVFAFDQEARHAAHAHALGRGDLGGDRLDVGVGRQQRLDHRCVHAAFARRLDQHRMVAEIGAFLEIELEQPPGQAVLHVRAGGSRPADDAVRVERVGRDLDGVEGEVDADRRRRSPRHWHASAGCAPDRRTCPACSARGPCLPAGWSGRAGTAASAPRHRRRRPRRALRRAASGR